MKRFISHVYMIFTISILFVGCSEDEVTKPSSSSWQACDLILVPATSGFPMGWVGVSNDEQPVHTVALDEFKIGKYEVTYSLWIEVKSWAEKNGYTFKNTGHQGYGENTTDQHPVTMISWRDCIAWCNAFSEKADLDPVYFNPGKPHVSDNVYRNATIGYGISNSDVEWNTDGFRLPTEAEWEYAARYVDGVDFTPGNQHSGCNISGMDDCVWHCINSGQSTHPVGEKLANSIEIHDMSGNVWEWCWDGYDADYYGSNVTENPQGPDPVLNFRVIRGGGWSDYWTCACRTSDRDMACQSYEEGFDLGFRVCRRRPPR